jgi:pseudouridine kinase
VGNDPDGDFLLASLSGVDRTRVRRAERTGSYLAVIDGTGDLVIGVADMDATEAIEDIGPVDDFDWLVLDGNFLPETIARALEEARSADVPVLLDPVGVAKAIRLSTVPELPVHTFTPNRDELLAFTGLDDAEAAIAAVHERGVHWLWLREGSAGSRLHGIDGTDVRIAAISGPVVDVTGAGDAMLAGYLHALGAGADPVTAAEYGAACATLTIGSPETVRPDLDDELVRRTIAAARRDPTR